MTTERSALWTAAARDKQKGVTGDLNTSKSRNTEQYSAIKNTSFDESDGRYVPVKSDEDAITIEQNKYKITNCQTLIHMLKTCMGSAILMAPNTFFDGGLWVGLGGVLLCAFLVIEGMQTLIRCSNHLTTKVNWPDGAMDFGDVAEYSFKLGPKRFRCLALPARFTVKLLVVILQIGTCAIYFVFVPSLVKGLCPAHLNLSSTHTRSCCDGSIPELHDYQFPENSKIVHQAYHDDPKLVVYMAVMLAIVLPYSLITSLRHLAITSAIGDILLIVGYGLILGYLVTDLPSVDTRPAFQSWDRLPFLIPKAVYAIEGIGSILPLMCKMHTPEDFGGVSGVLLLGMIIPISIYSAMGFYGYLRYGDSIHDIITLNLPQNDGLTIACEIIVAVAILLTFGVAFYVPVVQIWPWIEAKYTHPMWKLVGEYIFRIMLVLLTFGFAVAVPHLDLLMAFFGAVAGIGLGLIFPPLLDILCLASQAEERSLFRLIKNITILVFGITASIIGTYISLRDIILKF